MLQPVINTSLAQLCRGSGRLTSLFGLHTSNRPGDISVPRVWPRRQLENRVAARSMAEIQPSPAQAIDFLTLLQNLKVSLCLCKLSHRNVSRKLCSTVSAENQANRLGQKESTWS